MDGTVSPLPHKYVITNTQPSCFSHSDRSIIYHAGKGYLWCCWLTRNKNSSPCRDCHTPDGSLLQCVRAKIRQQSIPRKPMSSYFWASLAPAREGISVPLKWNPLCVPFWELTWKKFSRLPLWRYPFFSQRKETEISQRHGVPFCAHFIW